MDFVEENWVLPGKFFDKNPISKEFILDEFFVEYRTFDEKSVKDY